ncbi:DUF2188 domain-containing protein [Luteimonas sp. FCS-9]|uniref:DUF2188 domain-containing protein n=1 Tax=Luteimonas sp. FCS-9 TaxID=1547516 RepID=UPI00063EAF68|nr:DUF2188 domain-containing protein [Luteimonas sp. FCS-9]KLJ02427.1 hypothetical protein WQ56_02500 [Luteimonas sp. FCS-9]
MTPIRYLLRHCATSLDWVLVDAGSGRELSHHPTRDAAFRELACNASVLLCGAVVRVHGVDGGYEGERVVSAIAPAPPVARRDPDACWRSPAPAMA